MRAYRLFSGEFSFGLCRYNGLSYLQEAHFDSENRCLKKTFVRDVKCNRIKIQYTISI
jgi:hypothetical protein